MWPQQARFNRPKGNLVAAKRETDSGQTVVSAQNRRRGALPQRYMLGVQQGAFSAFSPLPHCFQYLDIRNVLCTTRALGFDQVR